MPSDGSHIGETIGHYTLRRELGRGGMGVVYEAVDTALDRTVAIKLLPAEACEDGESLSRFLLEARACARLDHPNIVTVYEMNQHLGRYYLVMEHVRGSTLADLLRDHGALNISFAVSIARQIAQALASAHAIDLIHRDIKPHNIMITESGKAKLLDFGLAKLFEQRSTITSAGAVLGTPHYMSPEQARGEAVDVRADIYSLGVVLFEMLTARCPFRGSTPIAVIRQVIDVPPPPIGSINPEIPDSLQRLVDSLLAKDKWQRPSSAQEVCDALDACLAELSTTSTAVGGRVPRPVVPPDYGLGPSSDRQESGDRRSRRFTSQFPIAFREPAVFALGAGIIVVLFVYLLQFVRQQWPDFNALVREEPASVVFQHFAFAGSALAVVLVYYSLIGKRLMWALSLAVGASMISLFLAHGTYASTPWQEAFGRAGSPFYGFFIEGGRSVLLAFIVARILGAVFHGEAATLFSAAPGRNWWVARVLVLTLGGIAFFNTCNYHLNPSEAPTQLALMSSDWKEWHDAHPAEPVASRNKHEFNQEFEIPYRWYLMYSIVNFVCIHIPILVVPLFAAVNDWERTDTFSRELFARMRAAKSPLEVRRLFGEFERACAETASKYVELPSWMAVLIFYEYFIGGQTLVKQAMTLGIVAIAVVAAVGMVVFFIALLYEKGFQQLMRDLENEEPQWVRGKNVFSFIRGLFTQSVSGFVLLALPCLAVLVAAFRFFAAS